MQRGKITVTVDSSRMIALKAVLTSLGGQADYVAAVVVDDTGSEIPMLLRVDAIRDDSTALIPEADTIEHEQAGSLPLDYSEAVHLNIPRHKEL